jgi:hypothetical protein
LARVLIPCVSWHEWHDFLEPAGADFHILLTAESLDELRDMREKWELHTRNFKDWLRSGGPINPIWARETGGLKRELHRAQCRAAARIYEGGQELASTRCLGAFQVHRQQRQNEQSRQRREREREKAIQRKLDNARLPPWQREQAEAQSQPADAGLVPGEDGAGRLRRRSSLEELVPVCNGVGKFERFGRNDVAFVCDFCDGFIVWQDVDRMPSQRTPIFGTGQATGPGAAAATADYPNWQASATSATTGEEKVVVFAPLAIANHMPPSAGDYHARIMCPYCDDYTYIDQGDADEEEVRYAQDEGGLPELAAFQEHLEWSHTAMPVPTIPSLSTVSSKCSVM